MRAPHEAATVLVIDDDQDVLELIRYLLEAAGHRIETALEGRAGLEAIDAVRPDLILLDLKMPVMDGPTFVAEFRKRHGGDTPIVVVTAADDARKRAADVGAADWLAKPFEPGDLLQVVARNLPARVPSPAATPERV